MVEEMESDWKRLFGVMLDNQRKMLAGGLYDDCIMTRVPPKFVAYCGEGECSDKCAASDDCLPWNVPQVAAYNVLHLTTEVSEVLQSDKRWKSIRKDFVDNENKIEEIADCFICLFNVAIWSGIGADELLGAILNKSVIYTERIKDEVGKRK